MVWRKWLVRGLVFTVAGCVTAAAAVFQHFTNPAAVRQQVIARLEEHLPGATVRVESANIHLMGGITFQDLHLCRRDDPSQTIFLDVPNGTIFHDKEQLLDGKVAIRKVEFDKPWLRVVREKNGAWNLTGILGAVDLTKSIPTIVLKQAIVYLEDKKASPPVAPLQIKDVNLSILNYPRDTLIFTGSGVCSLIGVIEISGSLGRANDQFNLSLHMPDVNNGGDLLQRLACYQPEAADHLRMLTGKCKDLQADLYYDPQTKPAWNYSLRGKIADGRFGHARLPMTLEQVEGDVSMINGELNVKKLTAHFGETRIELSGRLVPGNDSYDLEKGRLTVSRLSIDEALLQHMPTAVEDLNKMFRPRGPISFYVEADRHSGKWHTRSHFEPEDMRAACQKFPYELEHIRGTVEQESDPEHGLDLVKIDLIGHRGHTCRHGARQNGGERSGVGGRPCRHQGPASRRKNAHCPSSRTPENCRLLSTQGTSRCRCGHYPANGRQGVSESHSRPLPRHLDALRTLPLSGRNGEGDTGDSPRPLGISRFLWRA